MLFLFKLYPEKTEYSWDTSLDVHMDKVMTIETETKNAHLGEKNVGFRMFGQA